MPKKEKRDATIFLFCFVFYQPSCKMVTQCFKSHKHFLHKHQWDLCSPGCRKSSFETFEPLQLSIEIVGVNVIKPFSHFLENIEVLPFHTFKSSSFLNTNFDTSGSLPILYKAEVFGVVLMPSVTQVFITDRGLLLFSFQALMLINPALEKKKIKKSPELFAVTRHPLYYLETFPLLGEFIILLNHINYSQK